jgi:hypothetical protein
VYEALRFACIALFVLTVPLLLVARVRSAVPWWFVIASATAAGWILTNAAVFFQHAAIDKERIEELACSAKPINGDNDVTIASGGETIVENPCGIGEWIRDRYKPFVGLLYGPLYLLCCSLPYCLIVARRTPTRLTRQVVLLTFAVFAVEWAVILGECTGIFGGRISFRYLDLVCWNVDPYSWLPLTMAAAFLVGWIVATRVLHRFGRRG